ncbi:MAG: hypothetical protein NPIRA05_21200 [Nitrospirales bacterium]|nr:MAG: hypothetical protein NPIRA05_21200 [Nitrospirales bacterium]
MKHVFTVLMIGLFLVGASSVSLALDLGMGDDKVKDAEATMNEMAQEGEDKVKEAKGEEKEQSMAEKIQSKSKDEIKEKIDDMKSGMGR